MKHMIAQKGAQRISEKMMETIDLMNQYEAYLLNTGLVSQTGIDFGRANLIDMADALASISQMLTSHNEKQQVH